MENLSFSKKACLNPEFQISNQKAVSSSSDAHTGSSKTSYIPARAGINNARVSQCFTSLSMLGTSQRILLFLITEGNLQCHNGNSGFYFPDFLILSTQFSVLSFSQNLHVISTGNIFFYKIPCSQRGSGWELMRMHLPEKTHADCRKQREEVLPHSYQNCRQMWPNRYCVLLSTLSENSK